MREFADWQLTSPMLIYYMLPHKEVTQMHIALRENNSKDW